MEPSLALNYYVAKDDIILILPTLLPECCCYKLHSYLRTSRKDECFSAYIHARSHQKGRVREGPGELSHDISCLNVLWASEGRDQLSSTHSWDRLSLAYGILPMHGLGLALLHSSHHQGHPVAARKGQDQLSCVRATANADERQGSSPEP